MKIFKKAQPYAKIQLFFAMVLAIFLPIDGFIFHDSPGIWLVSATIFSLGLLFSFALAPVGRARIIFYIIFAAFFFLIRVAFFLSYYVQRTGFNEAFFYHIRPDFLYAGIKDYLPILLLIIVCSVGFLTISAIVLAKMRSINVRYSPFVLGLLIAGLFISPPVNALVHYVENIAPEVAASDPFGNFGELRGPEVTAEFSKSQRPNIVLIYAESLEQRFFDEAVFPGLMPNLKRLREESTDFSNVAQGVGAGWTVAGMVASQCGYPLSPSHDVGGNDLSLFDEFLPKANCLGDLLEKDGYHLTFIGGADVRFAGKGAFLRSHGYSEILDRDVLLAAQTDKSYVHGWGMFDDTLFDHAMTKFTRLSRDNSPFLQTLLTLDTHNPNGFLSNSCGTYGPGDNSYLNSVHCSDQLISQFVERIRTSPYSDNTIIIVLSDHLAMRNPATALLENSQMPSRLTFFVNTPDGKKEQNANPGVHYDIAPTILDLVGYKIAGQMGFGAPLTQGPGFLPQKFGAAGWEKESANLLAIGSTLWNNDVTLDQDGIKFFVSNLSLVMGGRNFNLRSKGISTDVPASTLLIFDDNSLKLEKIATYSFDIGLTEETLSRELLEHKEKLAFVISRARNLLGFIDRNTPPDQWVFYLGKPGSDSLFWKPITGDFDISIDLISKLSRGQVNDRVVSEREKLLKVISGKKAATQ